MTVEALEDIADVAVSGPLSDLLAAHPLPAGVPDADMNQGGIAAALNVTTNTVGKFVARSVVAEDWSNEEDFPVIEHGGMGKPYVIRLSHAYAWRQHRASLEIDRDRRSRDAIMAMQATFLGVDPSDEKMILDPGERRKMAEADIVFQKARMLRRQLVELDEITELLEKVFAIMRDGIEGMLDRLERELGLKPEQVSLVVRLGDDILNGVAQRIEAAELKNGDLTDDEIPDRILI